jgi:hypothetical protein
MARILANTPDTQAPDSDYLNGKILDQNNAVNPPIPGTPIVERLYGDIVEFFQKLMTMAGLTGNDLPDNETNGHQFIDALNDFVSDRLPSLNGKADKVSGAIDGNFASLNGSGNLVDSGTGPPDMSNSGPVMWDTHPTKFYSVAQNNAFNTSFGTTSGTTCQGNDGRLSDSRKCNNTFDTAATARTNLDVFSKAENGGILTSAPIEIGDWNMDADSSKTVSHALGLSIDKIIGAEAWIKNDSNTSRTLLSVSANDRISVLVDTIVLDRALGGFFDSAGYDQTSFNRGWIIIKYLP